MGHHHRPTRHGTWLAAASCAAVLLGCASDYVEPGAGPFAYVRFVDNLGPRDPKKVTLGPPTDRYSTAFIYPDASDCNHHDIVRNTNWVKVKANQEFVVEQHWVSGGEAPATCTIQYAGKLKEGQRVTYRFVLETTGRDRHKRDLYVCRVGADDASLGQVTPDTEALHQTPKGCSYLIL